MPSDKELQQFVQAQKMSSLSYSEVGATAGDLPNAYNIDHNRIQLGRGEHTWQAAVRAIRDWKMFNFSWVSVHPSAAPIQTGTTVAILARHLNFCSLNASRIVYVIDEGGSVRRFGFA